MTAGRTAASPVIRIHPADDVVIARRQLVGGTEIVSEGIVVAGLVPPGHKVAVRAIPAGAPVRLYNRDATGTSSVAASASAAHRARGPGFGGQKVEGIAVGGRSGGKPWRGVG